jgi:hypothetical protein
VRRGGRAACALYKAFEELQPRTQGPVSPLKLTYCDFPGVLPELEPLELPLLEPDPMPLPLEPLLDGVLGEVVELGEGVLLPLAPAPAPEPDLLKCASHSARETWPSLFVSTDEKLGAEELELLEPPDRPPLEPPEVALPPDAALPPEDDEPEADGVLELEPLEPDAAGDEELEDDGVLELEPAEPEAAGADDDDDLSAPLLLDEELCDRATPDSANNAAAVAALRTLSFNIG